MNDKYQKIVNSIEYARKNNIDPANPNTWDESYIKRQRELAGIIDEIESDINSIKEGIQKMDKS
jgi:hypothetical protein